MKSKNDFYDACLTGGSYYYDTTIEHDFRFNAESFTHTKGDKDMWTRKDRPHKVSLKMQMISDSIKPSTFDIKIHAKHEEIRKDYSTWVLTEKIAVPVALKENEYFVEFLNPSKGQGENDLYWEARVSGYADTSTGGDHGWISMGRNGFIDSAQSRIDRHGLDDDIQAVLGKLKIPFRIFVDVRS